jgi:hypothetical protein
MLHLLLGIWDGTIDRFDLRNYIEEHYGNIGTGYLFDSNFQEIYLISYFEE